MYFGGVSFNQKCQIFKIVFAVFILIHKQTNTNYTDAFICTYSALIMVSHYYALRHILSRENAFSINA